jgi:hypothetical protein
MPGIVANVCRAPQVDPVRLLKLIRPLLVPNVPEVPRCSTKNIRFSSPRGCAIVMLFVIPVTRGVLTSWAWETIGRQNNESKKVPRIRIVYCPSKASNPFDFLLKHLKTWLLFAGMGILLWYDSGVFFR